MVKSCAFLLHRGILFQPYINIYYVLIGRSASSLIRVFLTVPIIGMCYLISLAILMPNDHLVTQELGNCMPSISNLYILT